MAQIAREIVAKIGHSKRLDKVADPAAAQVEKLTDPKPIKNALSGVWLGHQLHPMLTDLPIGAWTMAAALDATMGKEGHAAAQRLVGIGILSALPAAASGASDWSTTYGPDKRVGLVHAWMNSASVVLHGASYVLRGRGHRALGVTASAAGLGLTLTSAYLGGHLSYVRGVGVNYDAFDQPSSKWVDVAAAADITEGRLTKVDVAGTPVVLTKHSNEYYALSDTCDHAGGPLNEGTLDGVCVQCPWHGSIFDMTDGHVVRGPASVPQTAWDVQVDGDRLKVRPTQA